VDDLEPLTPNHLLLLKGKPALPPGVFQKQDLYPKRRGRQVQYISDSFWKRWSREYLPLLQERQKCLEKRSNVGEGDIVLIVDERAPRWATFSPLKPTHIFLSHRSHGLYRKGRYFAILYRRPRPSTEGKLKLSRST
jgi:hypothetical protein